MSRIRSIAWIAALVAGVAMLVAGPIMMAVGFDGKAEVRDQLAAQKIVTPDDARIPGVPVVDGETAMVQAEIIDHHALEATGGKTYAEMDREDPNRAVAASAASLRTSLMSAYLAWNIGNLVIALGAAFTGLGLVFALLGVAIKPTTDPQVA